MSATKQMNWHAHQNFAPDTIDQILRTVDVGRRRVPRAVPGSDENLQRAAFGRRLEVPSPKVPAFQISF